MDCVWPRDCKCEECDPQFECPKCDIKHSTEEDMLECCPTYECYNCGTEHEYEYEAEECCASCEECGCSNESCCSCGVCDGCGCHCETCGCYAGVGSDVNMRGFNNETEVAERFRIKYDRDLPKHAADYYLLLHLHQIKKSPKAKKLLEEMAAELAPEFATYLDLACGGEVRYAQVENYSNLFDISPGREKRGTRGLAWDLWPSWKTLPERTQYAIDVFEYDAFWGGGGYGGPAWASIAKTLKLRVDKKIDDILWLDRVWNLQHNGGIALNKVYYTAESAGMRRVLEAHGDDDYDTMLEFASDHVKVMWQYREYTWDHWAHEVGDKYSTPSQVFKTFVEEKPSQWRGQLRWQNRFTSE
jgi:hypothetical protein